MCQQSEIHILLLHNLKRVSRKCSQIKSKTELKLKLLSFVIYGDMVDKYYIKSFGCCCKLVFVNIFYFIDIFVLLFEKVTIKLAHDTFHFHINIYISIWDLALEGAIKYSKSQNKELFNVLRTKVSKPSITSLLIPYVFSKIPKN